MAGTFTPKQIYQAQFTGTPGTSVLAYTVAASTIAMISTITVTNTTTSDATFRIYMSATGAAAAVGNAIFYDLTCPAKSTLTYPYKRILPATGTIRVDAGTTSAITFTIDGAEVSIA